MYVPLEDNAPVFCLTHSVTHIHTRARVRARVCIIVDLHLYTVYYTLPRVYDIRKMFTSPWSKTILCLYKPLHKLLFKQSKCCLRAAVLR